MARLLHTASSSSNLSQSALFITVMFGLNLMILPQKQVLADQTIGAIHTDSLTTYKPTVETTVQDVSPIVDQRVTTLDGIMKAAEAPPDKVTLSIDWYVDPGDGDPGSGGCGKPGKLEPFFLLTELSLENEQPGGGGGGSGGGFVKASDGGVMLLMGTHKLAEKDIHLPQSGPRLAIGRNYNPRQVFSGSHHDSAGYQGMNWFQTSQAEILKFTGATLDKDLIYLFSGADGFVEFKRKSASGTSNFYAANGGSAVFEFTAAAGAEPEKYTLTDLRGNQFVFLGFDSNANPAKGQLWKMSDPAGNTAYVGDSTTASTAISSGYDGSGRITKFYDSEDRRYTYTYSSGLLTEVKAETKTSGTWASPTGVAIVAKVEYSYYVNADTYGDDNDLKLVKVTTPLSDSGVEVISKTYYRYWQGTFNATTNPGHPHDIQYIYRSEGLRQFDWAGDSTFDEDFLTATENDLKPYASAYFKYDTDHRIVESWSNGGCGCSGASTGTYVFRYETNGSFSNTSGYDTAWYSRTVVKEPAKTDVTPNTNRWITQYFDEAGQPLSRVVTEDDPAAGSPPRFWATYILRDSEGFISEISSPANITAYTHSTGSFTRSTSVGLITTRTRVSSGDTKNLLQHVKYKEGTSGTAYLSRSKFYGTASKTIGDITFKRPVVVGNTMYTTQTSTADTGHGSAPPSGAYRTEMTYDFYDDMGQTAPLTTEEITATYPTVTTANNGSNAATTSKQHFRIDGRLDFAKAPDGIISYRQYSKGQVSKSIQDADTTQTASGQDFNGITIPSGFSTDTPSASFHNTTSRTFDAQGRVSTSTRLLIQAKSATVQDEAKSYISKLADNRLVKLSYAKYDSSTGKYYSPVSYSVSNHAGSNEVQATIELDDNSGEYTTDTITNHVDESASDPLLAIDWHVTNRIGTVARLSTNIYDETGGSLEQSRTYFLIPASGAGTAGTNYDATSYAYDNSGHRWHIKDATGTIQRTVYDTIGRTASQWIGTNDNSSSFPGGESSGTSNMVKIADMEYDSGNDKANRLVTKQTSYVEDSATDKRETTYLYDFRGRRIVQVNPNAPHNLGKFDDAGRPIANALYSSSSGLDATDDPTSLATNRMALSQTFYDEKGQVWKTQRHKIDDADGSDDDNLQELTWYDSAGRTIKVDGSQFTKTIYDRLGRTTDSFILASSDDSAYADADDVTGDVVLEQHNTGFDPNSGLALLSATISRFHSDTGTTVSGALDTNADADNLKYTAANVKGRIQISAMWYDSIDRMIDSVSYGTYNAADFDRDGLSVPSRSDTALRTTYVFNPDGSTKSVTDPEAIETRFTYDDAGRQTVIINNSVNGTPSSTTADDDVHTRFVYSNGQKTKMWVDFDGDNVEDTAGAADQVTTWTYGVIKGASAGDSKISSNSLLYKVVYPPQYRTPSVQVEADRRVLNAYNAQGQLIWTQDAETNVTEFNYDTSGRQTHKRLTTLASGFDTAIRRISSTFDSLGRQQLVSQYDNAAVGSGTLVDEVKFTYDDWSNVEKFEQDNNSAVGAGGSVDDYEVRYAFAKAATGRNTIRRTEHKLAYASTDLLTVSYTYSSAHSLHDADSSRVTSMGIGATTIVSYAYNGTGQLVGTTLGEPSIYNRRYTGAGTYPDLDRFNRVTSDTWHKDLSTDLAFYDYDIIFDRNSNITRTEDLIFTPAISSGFDVQYTMDDLNRLTKAEEGDWNGTSITSRSRQQIWTLTQTGNWDREKLDRNGDNDFVDATEHDDTRAHNEPNELTARDTDTNGTNNFTLTYSKRGDMTDDGENYEYEYDGFGRLRKIKSTSTQALVEEFWYNGVNHRISWKYDTDVDGDVDSNDKKFHVAYDERWRIVQTFREADTSAKEQFVYHNAGDDGYGLSSYIDAVVLREKDANSGWTSAADGTLESRDYYCQNWREDVVALMTSAGKMVDWVKYSAYGVPYGIPNGDTNGDGTVNGTDQTNINNWSATPATKPTGDHDLDGDIDIDDLLNVVTTQWGVTLGWGKLSQGGASGSVANRKGYAGYEFDPVLAGSKWHVRYRVLESALGSWITRDPLEYLDGMNKLAYIRLNPIARNDAAGLCAGSCDEQPACNFVRAQCRGIVTELIYYGNCGHGNGLSAVRTAQEKACSSKLSGVPDNCNSQGIPPGDIECRHMSGGPAACQVTCDTCTTMCSCQGSGVTVNFDPTIFGISICFPPSDCCVTVWIEVHVSVTTILGGQCQGGNPSL